MEKIDFKKCLDELEVTQQVIVDIGSIIDVYDNLIKKKDLDKVEENQDVVEMFNRLLECKDVAQKNLNNIKDYATTNLMMLISMRHILSNIVYEIEKIRVREEEKELRGQEMDVISSGDQSPIIVKENIVEVNDLPENVEIVIPDSEPEHEPVPIVKRNLRREKKLLMKTPSKKKKDANDNS